MSVHAWESQDFTEGISTLSLQLIAEIRCMRPSALELHGPCDRVQLVMQRGADGGGPVVDFDNDLASPPLWPRTAAAHPARQLRTGTELGVKRALSFPPPSTPPCSPKLNLSAVETPMPKRQRSHAPNAPQRNPLRADHRAPAGATIVDTPWRARHGSSGRVASRVRDTPARTLDESICDAVGLRQRDRRLNRPAPRSTTTD